MNQRIKFFILACVLLVTFAVLPAQAGSPTGNDWFQLRASPFTGGDNTGDGGTGNVTDLNYYYVGQTFTSNIEINVSSPSGSNASNIWIDYATSNMSAANLTTGTFFPTWASQSISGGRVYSTGYRTTGYSTGNGNFGSVQFTMATPTAAAYGAGSPTTNVINVGTIGQTTESNISYDGTDILDSVENFQLHVWADTVKPFAETNNIASGTSGVLVDSIYQFRLFDTKLGEGFSTSTAYNQGGVGTGVNTSEPPGVLSFNGIDYTAYDTFSCSGVWGTNVCNDTVDPPPPSGIAGDGRNWNYSTTYWVNISGFRDLASPNQTQLGDAPGPNTMNPKTFSFTTEADTVAPRVVSETPVRFSSGVSVSTNIVINIEDRKTYPNGISGVGLVTSTCSINVSSPSTGLQAYNSLSPEVTVSSPTPSGYPSPFGLVFTINPAVNFAQNETVSVSVSNCQDSALNTMVADNWTFLTADTEPPFVDNQNPVNDTVVTPTTTIVLRVADLGTGVDINSTVVYINGSYWTNSGGAGTVTINGTRITYASSSNFNGGNYPGDTTNIITTSSNAYFMTIDPQADFADGEAIPIIVYARDLSGNIMERVVYAITISGTAMCTPGSAYCGVNSSWDGSMCIGNSGSGYCGLNTSWDGLSCIGTGGGTGSGFCGTNTSWDGAFCIGTGGTQVVTGGGGSGSVNPTVNEFTVTASQVDDTTVLVTWTTNIPGYGRVVYGTESQKNVGPLPYYGYEFSTPTSEKMQTYHTNVITGLKSGNIYYFRPIILGNGLENRGPEVLMAPFYPSAQICSKMYPDRVIYEPRPTEPIITKPVITSPAPKTIKPYEPSKPISPSGFKTRLKIINIEQINKRYVIQGESAPDGIYKITVY